MELIDRKALLEKAYYRGKPATVDHPYPDGAEVVDVEDIEDAPVIEAIPVIHAKWIPIVNISTPKEDMEKIGSKCSNCGGHGHYTDRYCKHCGALMED